MRIDARKKAEESFDYRVYIPKLKEFIEQECRQNEAHAPGARNYPRSDQCFAIAQAAFRFPFADAWGPFGFDGEDPFGSQLDIHALLSSRVGRRAAQFWIRQLKYMSRLGQFISLDDAVDALHNPKGLARTIFLPYLRRRIQK